MRVPFEARSAILARSSRHLFCNRFDSSISTRMYGYRKAARTLCYCLNVQ